MQFVSKPQTLNNIEHTQEYLLREQHTEHSMCKCRFPLLPYQLPALHHHCKVSKWDLVQTPGSHTQGNSKLICSKGLPALQGFTV